MNTERWNSFNRAACLAAFAATGCMVTLAWWPLESWPESTGDSLPMRQAASLTEDQGVTVSQFQDVWDVLNTQQASAVTSKLPTPEMAAPAVARPSETSSTKAMPRFRLLGTIEESDRWLAFVADQNGKIDFCGIGEELELAPQGAKLVRVSRDQARIEIRRDVFEISIRGPQRQVFDSQPSTTSNDSGVRPASQMRELQNTSSRLDGSAPRNRIPDGPVDSSPLGLDALDAELDALNGDGWDSTIDDDPIDNSF